MPVVVVDEPPDRANETELASGADREWGIGQIAAHLLIVERGVLGIALRLAKGEAPGATGQPRPAAAEVSRDGIHALAQRARRAAEAFRAEFPAQPDDRATARHPFYGDMNRFGWLLTLPNHYYARLTAHDRGAPSAL